jgi:spore coat polysaccharide biosynthesis protein SpsF
MSFKTKQENLWAGEFGNEYTERSKNTDQLTSGLNFFSRTFEKVSEPESLIEFGTNIGVNLKVLKQLFPSLKVFGIEINKKAAEELSEVLGEENVFQGSIVDFEPTQQYEVALVKGVLIHVNPDMLGKVYEKLYTASSKYILICEYYNPSPVSINYRGYNDLLFKRDFAGEMLEKYNDLQLMDYGFCYKRDKTYFQDDVTWFLLRKNFLMYLLFCF